MTVHSPEMMWSLSGTILLMMCTRSGDPLNYSYGEVLVECYCIILLLLN